MPDSRGFRATTTQPCPYCHRAIEYVPSSTVGIRTKGMIYLCRPCNAWAAADPVTRKPYGTLANKELREARHQAYLQARRLQKKRGAARKRLCVALKLPELNFKTMGMELASRVAFRAQAMTDRRPERA